MLIDRRQFCAGLALAPLFELAATGLARGEELAPRVRLGFSLYGMKSLPLVDAVKTCAEIGYEGIELSLLPGYSCDPQNFSTAARKELRSQLADLNLAVPAVMDNLSLLANENVHRANLERIARAAEVSHEIVPKAPPLLETVLGGGRTSWENTKSQMVARLGEWAKAAEAHDLTIAIKPHVMNALHQPEDAIWLLDQVASPRIKLAYDYSHYACDDLELDKTLATLLPRSVFVHVKDSSRDAGRVRFYLPGAGPAGKGHVDYETYFRLLTAARYPGFVVVEVSGMIFNEPGYDAKVAAQKSFVPLAQAREAIGPKKA